MALVKQGRKHIKKQKSLNNNSFVEFSKTFTQHKEVNKMKSYQI